MANGDRDIYRLFKGRMQRVQDPLCDPARSNFLIVCDYGDWSGFRTLDACIAQFGELEKYAEDRIYPHGFYRVVER